MTPEPTSSASVVRVTDRYELDLLCGIREARIGQRYYYANPQPNLDPSIPPNASTITAQDGTMTMYDDGTARLNAGPLVATFTLREGASDWLDGCF